MSHMSIIEAFGAREHKIKRYCVFGCDVLIELRVPLHRFPHPVKRSELFATWVSIVGHKRLKTHDPIKIYKSKKICDQHFEPIQKTSASGLISSAVPSINLKRMRQSIATFIQMDHQYCVHRREWEKFVPGPFPSKSSPTVKSTSTTANTVEGTAKEETVMDENTTVANDDPCHDNDDDDNVVQNTPVPESEKLPQVLFSWEKTDTIVADDTMVVSEQDLTLEAPELTLNLEDVSMYSDEQSSKDDNIGSQFAAYLCNMCGEKITGFRYTCVQCADWDLCAACEARAAHDTHYVLRVPGQRPYEEVQAMLTAVRQHVLSENMFLTETIASMKDELLDEEAEVPEGAPEVEGDPLGSWNFSHHDDDCDTLENNPDPNEDGRPPGNRRRTSLDPLAPTQNFTPRDYSSFSNLTVTNDDPMEANKDSTRNDNGKTCNTRFDYSNPIKIIDINKLTRNHKQTKQDSDITDIIQITKENGIEVPKDRLDDILDTNKHKLKHTEQQKLVSSLKTPLAFKRFLTYDETRKIRTQSKEIGPDGKGAYKTISKVLIGQHVTRIGSHRVGNTVDKTRKRYKILLPAGDQWKKILMTMLKSRVTVQLVDVMRVMQKIKEHTSKKTINEI